MFINTKKRELSLVSKYIKDRIKEIEITMEVRGIKQPFHLNNLSFEKKMRRKLQRAGRSKRIKMTSSFLELDSNDLSSELIMEESSVSSEISETGNNQQTVCPLEIKRKVAVPSADKNLSKATKKMKCGCISHSTKAVISEVSPATRRKTTK